MRQKDEQFAEAVTDIFNGILSERVKSTISKLKRPLPPCDSVKLFSTNILVDTYNRKRLLAADGELLEFSAVEEGDRSQLNSLTVPKVLWLKLGSPVILLRNISDYLVNGLRGTLVKATCEEIVVNFQSINRTEILKKKKFTVFDPRVNADIASRLQFPVKPAYALTIHKAQGLTLPWVEVDCRDIFRSGQLGVAVSRVLSPSGLRIINFHPRCLFSPQASVKQLMDMETQEPQDDLSCCRFKSANIIDPEESQESFKSLEVGQNETNELNLEQELEDDFNDVLAAMDDGDHGVLEYEIPENFKIQTMLEEIEFQKEFGKTRPLYNSILS